jgi:general secretion pathway protein L
MADQEGIGLAIVPDESEPIERQVLQTLQAMVMQVPIAMYVPQSQLQAYQHALEQEEGGERVALHADSWSYWIAGASHATLDLASGMQDAGGSRIDWKKWRWPVMLGTAFLLVNILALNIEWWRLRSEADQLRASMTQIYRATFPKDPVIVDPLAQMRQKLGAARRGGSPDDFTTLAAIVAEELNGLTQSKGGPAFPGIAGLEYKERSLTVKFKPGSDVPADQMKAALVRRNLELTQGPSQGGGTVWQIRSAR